MKDFISCSKYSGSFETYFSREHIWIRKNIYGLVKLGVDDYAVHSLCNPGVKLLISAVCYIRKGDNLFELEGKSGRLTLYSPIDCKIEFSNPVITWEIIDDPYNDDWIALVLFTGYIYEKNNLFNRDEYTKWLERQYNQSKRVL